MSKVRFRVVSSSGSSPEHEATQLHVHSPHTRGWQSPQFCEYPQEIVLALEGTTRLTQVQVLSHQSKIATKIELHAGRRAHSVGSHNRRDQDDDDDDDDDYKSAHFKRLGYLSLDSNERSKYQARELKSVYIDTTCDYLRLVVGIIAVNLLGEPALSSPGNQRSLLGDFSTGEKTLEQNLRRRRKDMDDLSFDMNFDPDTAQRIRDIAAAKERAVKSEDYDAAKELKIVETQLKGLGAQLAQLEIAKREAVEDEDYDKAKLLKGEIQAMRQQIEVRIAEAHIPQPVTSTASLQHSHHKAPQVFYPEPPVVNARGDSANDKVPVSAALAASSRPPPPSPVRGNGGSYRAPEREPGTLDMGDGSASLGLGGSTLTGPTDERPISSRGKYDIEGRADIFPAEGSAEGGDEEFGYGSPPVAAPRILYSRGGQESHAHDSEVDGARSRSLQQQPKEWAGGMHPLEGVPNSAELPVAEEISGVDPSEVSGLVSHFGEYIARCVYSKSWQLREAAMVKLGLICKEREEQQGHLDQEVLPSLWQVLRLGCDDKIAQVFTSTLDLLATTVAVVDGSGGDIRHGSLVSLADPVCAVLLLKLGDGQSRVREGGLQGLLTLSRSKVLGSSFVASAASRPMSRKQATAWRPIVARLQLLASMVSEFGLSGRSGLSADAVMGFIKACNGFAHSNAHVRDAARHLTVVVHAAAGAPAVEKYLTELRPKQREEYEEAFGAGPHATPDPPGSAGSSRRPSYGAQPQERGGHPQVQTAASKGGGSRDHPHGAGANNHSLAPEPYQTQVEGMDAESDTEKTCQFCGKFDPSFTEEQLDLHYWQACPMLLSCNECGQVIEISGLPEHLLDECSAKSKYVECQTTGLAVRRDHMREWQGSRHCVPPRIGGIGSICPLCFMQLGSADDEEIWRAHLIEACPKNPRRA